MWMSGAETNGWAECQQWRCPCCWQHICGWKVPPSKGFFLIVPVPGSQILLQVIRKSLVENKNDLEIQRKDPNCPLYSVKSFEELNLQPNLLKGVYAMGFNAPSKIQVLIVHCLAPIQCPNLGNSFADTVGGPSTEHDCPVAIWDGQDCCICACNALQGQHRPQTPPGRNNFSSSA